MGASVALPNGFKSVASDLGTGAFVAAHLAQDRLHIGAAAGAHVILPGAEEPFLILPWRAQQKDAAGHDLEHADRRNAAQAIGILAAWNVQCDPGLVVSLGRAQ